MKVFYPLSEFSETKYCLTDSGKAGASLCISSKVGPKLQTYSKAVLLKPSKAAWKTQVLLC